MERLRPFLTGAAVTAALVFLSGCLYVHDDQVQPLKFGSKVGVVEINGPVTESKDIVRHIAQFRDDGSVKAVVLRIDSPGGAVGSVQEIYGEVMRLREGKKVVVSMGNAAASGGYYIAAAADRIFANPGTVTGSIGVVAQIADLGELMDLLKIRIATVKSGKFKDSGTFTRPLAPEERELLQGVVAEVHDQFVRDIARGRKKEVSTILPAADGRIITGAKAKEMGLVDDLGNFQDAVSWAGTAAGLGPKPRVVYARKKRPAFLREILDSMFGEIDEMGSEASGVKLKFQ
ncbi:MAG: signal peptide peptidase SppA [Deltaproteobacteria bacterium]|nr:signal peptide peptidase SppA [Deltaproteobacteria bacterium]